MKNRLLILLFILLSGTIFSQTYTWVGGNDTDFFNESNWIDSTTGLAPTGNPINGGTAINRPFIISNVSTTIIAASEINLGTTGSLTITNATITANAIRGGSITINENGYLNLELSNALRTALTEINLNSGTGWVRTKLISPSVIQSTNIGQFKVNTVAASYPSNLRLDNYYFGGTVVRSNVASATPVTFYDRPNLEGTSVSLAMDIVHRGNAITNLNNKIESFVLKKGFMLTIADDPEGTGKSKNYIASEEDLTVNKLPTHLLNAVSFARVVPWNWVSKKGIGGDVTGLDHTWFYRWANNGLSTIDTENTPMAWGVSAADDDADIEIYKTKYKSTHVLGFNESDNCADQSGQYRNLCQEDVAIGYYRNLMKSGLRIVSPAGRENAPKNGQWLHNFYNRATAQDIRIDVIAVHWYDWSSNPEVNTNPTAQQVFDRFKAYLTDVYNRFGLPIWITEFNANPNRSNAINLAFMELALPYLETLDYVERYAWFEPVSDVADYFDGSNNLTNVGTFYKNQVSTPSIPETTISDSNNIDTNYTNNPTKYHNIITNGTFETGDVKAWLGTNHQVVTDADNTSTNLDIFKNTAVGNIGNDAGNLYQAIEVAPNVSYTVSFDYKWLSGAGNYNLTARVYRDLNSTTSIGSVALGTNPDVWYNATFNFTAPTNVFKARLYFDKATGNRPVSITNVKITLNPNKIWDGSESNDWYTAGNWVQNSVPTTSDVVFIARGVTNYPTVSGDITVARLFIDSGASFITSGNVVGTETYFIDLPDDKWYLLTPPVVSTGTPMNNNWVAAAGIATGQGSNIAIGSYDNSFDDGDTGPWRYFTGTASNFNNGQGYAMKKLSKGMFIFNGNLATFPKNLSITQGAATHWDLIGNPATSHLNVEAFLIANTTPLKDSYEAVFVWNADTNSYNALTTGHIQPGQAFFVNSNATSISVTVTDAMLSHQENVLFYKSTQSASPSIKLFLSDGTISKETEINYLEGKTTGLDPRFDIGLFDGVASDVKIYSHLISQNEGIPFMKQALPNAGFENMVVPIGIKAKAGKELIFSLEAANFPEGIFVYLEDRFTNSVTRLNEANANYKVTFTENFDTTGRFFLHTKSSGVLSTEDVNLQHISIYKTSNATLRIVGLTEGNANVTLFSVLGKQVLKTNFQAKTISEIDLPKLAKGVYFVKLQHEDVSITKKIILE